jgi:broad specificity phosphatase PhoE
LYLIRHSAVTIQEDKPGWSWHLSPEGRALADALAGEAYWSELAAIHTSPEPKAVGTAQRIAARHELPLYIEPDLREVGGRPWVSEGYRDLVQRYLGNEDLPDWEPHAAVRKRVRACVEGINSGHVDQPAGIVSHGLALTIFLTELLRLDAAASFSLWSGLALPDVAIIDIKARRFVREFGS